MNGCENHCFTCNVLGCISKLTFIKLTLCVLYFIGFFQCEKKCENCYLLVGENVLCYMYIRITHERFTLISDVWIRFLMKWSQGTCLVIFGCLFGCWSCNSVTFIDILFSKVQLND